MNVQIYEEATDWMVKHRNGGLDAGEKKSFDAWLRESPQHVHAYVEMTAVWEDVPALDRGWNASADDLIAHARDDNNVVTFSPPALPAEEPVEHRLCSEATNIHARWKHKLFYALAASVPIAFAVGWFYFQSGVYATDVGEQRSLALADGSTVELNSMSRIRVRYSERERHIYLLQGQALFHVARNKTRPFIVQADGTRVRAVGTAFDVYQASSGTIVSVVEGRVAVHRRQRVNAATNDPVTHPNGSAQSIELSAGEQLVVTSAAELAPTQANMASVTAWTQRNLVFDSSPLTEVAQEFNRYNTRRLVIESPQLAQFHISGVFSSVEPTLFLKFLHAQPELIVQETATDIRIRKKELFSP